MDDSFKPKPETPPEGILVKTDIAARHLRQQYEHEALRRIAQDTQAPLRGLAAIMLTGKQAVVGIKKEFDPHSHELVRDLNKQADSRGWRPKNRRSGGKAKPGVKTKPHYRRKVKEETA